MTSPRIRRFAPIVTLLLLAPVIGEVMSGATRLSYIFVLIPEIMVWGCGALLIREAVRRWQGGWTSMLLLGLSLAIAEEFIIQQTSLAPLPWAASSAYGRVWGVNWPYLLFMLGYEAVWIVLVPVQVTELIFSEHRSEPWLRTRGILAACAVFLFGSFIAWFLWTQRARPLAFHVPVYHPPAVTVLTGLLTIMVLAFGAFRCRHLWTQSRSGYFPKPWVAATSAVVLGLPWYSLMALVFGPARAFPVYIPMAIALGWAAGIFFLVRQWALNEQWHDVHRWALCLGALLVCMSGGFLGSSSWPRSDVVAKVVLNLIAVACMVGLAMRIKQRSAIARSAT